MDDAPETDDALDEDEAPDTDEAPETDDSPEAEDLASDAEHSSPSVDDEPANKEPEPDKPVNRFWGIARLMFYVGIVLLVIGVFMAGSTYQEVGSHALDVGKELGELGDIGPKTPIQLNGQPIHVGSSMHTLSVAETLDRAEAYCRGTFPIGNGKPMMFDENTLDLMPSQKANFPVVRKEKDGNGVVLCFAPRDGEAPASGMAEKITRFVDFMETGELSALGEFHYMFARPTEGGGTHLVRVWTPESFNLYRMTSTDGGDAPGTDPEDMPRPPKARRLLSATVPNVAYANRVYESSATPDEVGANYDETMPERGWVLKFKNGPTRVYNREQVSVFVTSVVRDGRTLVSLLHMGDDSELAREGP